MLYQVNPTEYLKAHPGRTSWTESLHLYWKAARKQAHLLRVNSRLARAAYTWEAVIYFHGTMTPADLPPTRSSGRKSRRGWARVG